MTEPVKMEGLGNKFIVFKAPKKLNQRSIRALCEQYQVDGLLIVTSLNDSLVEMKYWNADGSVAEMCGNGLRCVTRFAVDNNMVKPGDFNVNTDVGKLKVHWSGNDPAKIEVQVGKAVVDEEPLTLYGYTFYRTEVGNPHAVTFVINTKNAQVKEIGPKVETDSLFPHKTNVEFVQILNNQLIRVRTWERGSGETLACGTGMVAAANVAVKAKKAEFPLKVEVLGGSAKIWVDNDGFTRMIGPAQYY